MWGISDKEWNSMMAMTGCLLFLIFGGVAIGLWELGHWLARHFHWTWQ